MYRGAGRRAVARPARRTGLTLAARSATLAYRVWRLRVQAGWWRDRARPPAVERGVGAPGGDRRGEATARARPAVERGA